MRTGRSVGARLRAAAGMALVAALLSCQLPGAAAPNASDAPRVLLISLDGFRWDYLDRPEAANLRALAARGVRAQRLIPVFPSKTFPNHYSIVTGLTAEEHGIVANNIWDLELGLFTLRDTLAQSESRWWGGEPIWVTAELQGRRAASVSWPGSEAAIKGVRPSWWERYWHDEPHEAKVRKILRWLALPPDSAPAIITAYFHDVDGAGHTFGPDAPETNRAIAMVDRSVGAIVQGIADLGLSDVVNVIIVSDHGMAATSAERVIVLDDFIDLSSVEIVDWTPVAAIAPRTGEAERVYQALRGKHPRLQVYRKGEVPARWHFNAHPRITEIVAVADEGWTIASRATVARWREREWTHGGTHGYDPDLVSMGALFVAAGPGIASGRLVRPFRNVHIYPLMAQLLRLAPAATSGSLDSVRAVLR
jgi:predicted AlkP superfamily pyrophosphatase or phosphodiesterase